jgi:hypothetical protein
VVGDGEGGGGARCRDLGKVCDASLLDNWTGRENCGRDGRARENSGGSEIRNTLGGLMQARKFFTGQAGR